MKVVDLATLHLVHIVNVNIIDSYLIVVVLFRIKKIRIN